MIGFDKLQQLVASDVRWREIQNASFFITGGSGLFGRWLISALLEANRRLGTNITATVLTRNPEALRSWLTPLETKQAITVLQGDVLDFEFPKREYTHIIHMATTSAHETFAGEDSLSKYHMLTRGTERVMQFAAQSCAKKVLFTSSGVAYGAYPESLQRVPETYAGAPATTDAESGLGQGKRSAEFICSYYANRFSLSLSIARCFSFVGPGIPLNIHYAIGNFIRDALAGNNIVVKGNGLPMRSFLYLGDLVHWLLAILVDGKHNTVYNVGSDQAVSISELAHLVRDLLAPHASVIVQGNAGYSVGNFNRNWYVPDITRAKSELDVEVWTTLEKAIQHSAELNYSN